MRKYDGNYEKIEYRIKTYDGRILCPCWPNAGKFFWLQDSRVQIDENDIDLIEKAENRSCYTEGQCYLRCQFEG